MPGGIGLWRRARGRAASPGPSRSPARWPRRAPRSAPRDSTAACISWPGLREPREFHHWADFDGPLPGGRKARRDPDGFIQVVDVDQVEPAERLARFGERAVGDDPLALPDAHAR